MKKNTPKEFKKQSKASKTKVASTEEATFSVEEDISGGVSVGLGEGQSLISSPILKKKEASESTRGALGFDSIDLLRGVRVLLSNPKNQEQIEIFEVILSGVEATKSTEELIAYLEKVVELLSEEEEYSPKEDFINDLADLCVKGKILLNYLKEEYSKIKTSTEAYYNEGSYDEDQVLTLQVLTEDGKDIAKFVTPDNSPEQMFEIANALDLKIPEDKIEGMSDPTVSFMALQVINKAWKKGIDLTVYLPWADPFVLNQALLGAQKKLNLSLFIKPGLDHRQIEQLRKELEAGGDPLSLSGNYNEMRAKRFPGHNISNLETPVPKGKGTSQKKKGGLN